MLYNSCLLHRQENLCVGSSLGICRLLSCPLIYLRSFRRETWALKGRQILFLHELSTQVSVTCTRVQKTKMNHTLIMIAAQACTFASPSLFSSPSAASFLSHCIDFVTWSNHSSATHLNPEQLQSAICKPWLNKHVKSEFKLCVKCWFNHRSQIGNI